MANIIVNSPNGFSTLYGKSAAPLYDWTKLANALRLDSHISTADISITLNEQGEYSGRPYQEIANYVSAGGVWIEWCGWPLSVTDFGAIGDFPANFTNLMSAMDVGVEYIGSTDNQASFAALPSGWPYERSLVLTSPPTGKGFIANTAAPHETTVKTLSNGTVENIYVYSSFGVRFGKGAYFYAYGNTSAYTPFEQPGPGHVPFDEYWPFIQKVLYEVLGYGLTSTSPPSCGAQYGTYKGQTKTGLFIYQEIKGNYNYMRLIDGNCLIHSTYVTPLSNPTAIPSTPGQTATTYARGKCPLGIYMGDGTSVGANAKYDAYMLTSSTGYTYYLVDPNSSTPCKVLFTYHHTHLVQASTATGGLTVAGNSSAASSGNSSGSSSGASSAKSSGSSNSGSSSKGTTSITSNSWYTNP